MMMIKRKRLKLIVKMRLIIFFLIIIRKQQLFLTERMILTQPCHYISSGSDNEPTFEQFVLHQRSIEKNNVVDNNNSESSTVTETISDMCLVNKFKEILGYISEMSNSNSESSLTNSDDSVYIQNKKKQKITIKGNDY